MSDETAVSEAAPPSPTTPPERSTRPRLRLAMVAVVIFGAVGFLLIKGLGSSLDYFKTVDQAVHQRQQLGTSSFRLEGVVVPGSVHQTATGARFSVSEGTSQVPVVNQGSPPELFKANMPVIVVGHFASSSSEVFESNQIMVKHSSSYIAQHPNRVRAGNGSVN